MSVKILTDGSDNPSHIVELNQNGTGLLKIRNMATGTFETFKLTEQLPKAEEKGKEGEKEKEAGKKKAGETKKKDDGAPPAKKGRETSDSAELKVVFSQYRLHQCLDVEYFLQVPEDGDPLLKVIVWSKNVTHKYFVLEPPKNSQKKRQYPFSPLTGVPSFGSAKLTKIDERDITLTAIYNIINERTFRLQGR